MATDQHSRPANQHSRPANLDIYDPDRYVAGVPHDVFDYLREHEPVFWQDMPDGPGYWAVLKHGDVVEVARQANLYSASEGGVVLEDLAPDQLSMMRDMLLAMDPPRHTGYRQPLAQSFKARVIGKLEARVREIVATILDQAQQAGDVEFVHDVTSFLPSQIVGELMGLPKDDLPQINRWAEMNTSGQDPDLNPESLDPEGYANPQNASRDMAIYAMGWAARRRQEEPREDLTSLILGSEFNGRYMTDADFGSFFVQLVTAGNDTTKTMLSSGLEALLDHPDQLDALRRDRSLIASAVEEILRYANPLHYFRRTATADVTLRGVDIKEGDKVAMYYSSANRDEDVFPEPHRFDIRRQPNPHLSFGIATHFCLGVHLARLEGRVFFEELLARFATIEMTAPPVRTRSNLNNALKSMPVRLTAR
jgi:cytochrome P450